MIPESKFEIDGNEYKLRFSTKTIINIEKELGKPIGSIVDVDENNVSIEMFGIFFKEGIRDIDGKKVQPGVVDELLDTLSIEEFMQIVQTGFNQIFPKDESEGDGEGN